MKPSVQKLHKMIKLEVERGYDNRAVVGGLSRIVDSWEAEARFDQIPEELIQAVGARLRDYPNLSINSRYEVLSGLYRRLELEAGAPQIDFPPPPAPEREPVLNAVENGESLPSPRSDSSTQNAEISFPARRGRSAKGDSTFASEGQPAELNAPITVLPGIGTKNAAALSRLGLVTLRDMLYFFPRRYDDYSRMKPINRLSYGENSTVIGTVLSISTRTTQNGKKIVEGILNDGTASMRITWFNPYEIKRLHGGMQISVAGKTDQYLGRMVMTNPSWEPVEEENLNTGRIVPIYPSTANISQKWLRDKFNLVVNHWAPRLQDPLPESIRRSAELVDLHEAILQMHYPESWERLEAARKRLAFDEVFLLQLGFLGQKRNWQARTGKVFAPPEGWLEEVIQRLPFSLTGAQQRSIQDIQNDLASGKPMNRLLQGDVGSGKTIIAALAVAIVTREGSQAALMAPTSILAEQHYKNLLGVLATPPTASEEEETPPAPLLDPSQIRLMIGATPEAEKREIRDGLADGRIKLVIGTHALIEEPVTFSDLQLTIVDEQHRFGVEQRATLRSKGTNPHLLVMTATPIPRSLALSVYGDLDLSIIDEMPPGRQTIHTYVLTPVERERAYQLIRSQIDQGRQAFIIYPLVEEIENSEMKAPALAAVDQHARLQNSVFPRYRVGLLHGRMRPDEKEDVMNRFRSREFDILVSTSVVEVGVDVPNATVMLIEGANRFGLAQLHQFRGRVGRGSEKSFCLLIPDTADAIENERLQVMAQTDDGFVLAEYDLKQRGPGEFLGTRQSGFSPLQLANLTNVPLIDSARRHAQALFEADPELGAPEHRLIAASLERFLGGQGDVS